MQNLFPDQWTKALSQPKIHSAYEILEDGIKRTYERLSKQQDNGAFGGYCFSFFVDGLDEYQATTSADRREMVRCLTDLSSSASGSFKICVSSRIENPFMDMFSEGNRLYLHELTKSDIEEYVQGTLQHVGTPEECRILALSNTKKAEGVFFWVVLVVQKIRQQSANGAKFPRLLKEIESLPSKLNELFERILETLEDEDRQLLNHTVSLLHFVGAIPMAKEGYLWPSLSDFYFLEDCVHDPHFAESTNFPGRETETIKDSKIRAIRQLRGVCRGLIERDKSNDLNFTHRSVSDFFTREKVRIPMYDTSSSYTEVLSQLKLASIKQYWWDAERECGLAGDEQKQREAETLNRHSILVACLVQQRRQYQLDTLPFIFLECLDTISQLSVSRTVTHARTHKRTSFHIFLSEGIYNDRSPYEHYEVCHNFRVRHEMLWYQDDGSFKRRPRYKKVEVESPTVIMREVDERVEYGEYSRAVISPLFTELCSGRIEFPF